MINPSLDPEWDAFKELFPYLNYNAYKKLKDFFKYGYQYIKSEKYSCDVEAPF
jgi:hypothetical protein